MNMNDDQVERSYDLEGLLEPTERPPTVCTTKAQTKPRGKKNKPRPIILRERQAMASSGVGPWSLNNKANDCSRIPLQFTMTI